MITNIHIENFKSIQSLDLELGRLNIFIGANGSGKSNILEAIAMGSAAMEDKLDDEFLAHRGIRITDPSLMSSRFNPQDKNLPIRVNFSNRNIKWGLEMYHAFRWKVRSGLLGDSNQDQLSELHWLDEQLAQEELVEIFRKRYNIEISKDLEKNINLLNVLLKEDDATNAPIYPILKYQIDQQILLKNGESNFINFLIYAPENYFLRKFEEEGAIKPLGIRGEGIFKLFSDSAKNNPKQFEAITETIEFLFDWCAGIEIPKDLQFTERRIKIKDQYLADDLQYFDQRSANEGFLYLLFYLTLFVSDLTPHFFAIDNIDNSLNPKLGSELIKVLAQLAKKHNKQALLTTHNPVILDGLDLEDDDQRLFVVYRNADGHTKVRRVPPLKQVNGVAQVRLSEAFIRGYIGGLPDNF